MVEAAARFWAKVDTTAGVFGCWLWIGAVDVKGYGRFRGPDGRTVLAHRYSLLLAGRPLDPEIAAMHSCDNPPCVNPVHLSGGTIAENNADMARKGRARGPGLIGERVGTAKLTPGNVAVIRRLASDGVSQRRIARMFGVGQSTVGRVIVGRTWSHVA